MKASLITVDVREDIRSGREPFSKIMSAVASLAPSQDLLLIAPFEPGPLFDVLGNQGFTHSTRRVSPDHWEVLFQRSDAEVQPKAVAGVTTCHCAGHPAESPEIIELDARGLEPPQPLVKILEAVSSLRHDSELRAQTDRRPIHLYAQLEVRGFTSQTEETKNGSFITHIRRS